MNSFKTRGKELVGEALLRMGVWRRCLRGWAGRGEAIILIYHRVIEKWDRTLDYSQPGMVVTADTFERQLQFLKKHFHIVPLSSFLNPTPNTQHPKPLCAITFDDGWRDNYEIAFPILQKHSVPATIFLTTDFIGTNRAFWHTELMYLLMHGDLSKLLRNESVFRTYPGPVRYRLMRLARTTTSPAAQAVDLVIEAVKEKCDEPTIEDLIHDLSKSAAIPRPMLTDRRFFLDWAQIREMAAAGIEIGSHGCSHRILTRLKPEEAKEELTRSKADIESRIGRAVQHFAFPEGAANAGLMPLVRESGYRTASLCRTVPEGRQAEPVALRRLGMHEGVAAADDGSFSGTSLLLWLLRAPRIKPGLHR